MSKALQRRLQSLEHQSGTRQEYIFYTGDDVRYWQAPKPSPFNFGLMLCQPDGSPPDSDEIEIVGRAEIERLELEGHNVYIIRYVKDWQGLGKP